MSFVNRAVINITFFLAIPILCMTQEKRLVPLVNRVGLFNMLPPKFRKRVFEQLKPADINALRKSCYLFSQVFSFCRPTIEFVSYANQNIHPKDLKAILFSAVWDKKKLLVQTLWSSYRDFYKKDTFYQIDGMLSGLVLSIENTEENTDNNCLDLSVSEKRTLSRPDELLIACISRDSQRVLRALQSGNFDLDPKIDFHTLELTPHNSILKNLGFTLVKPTSKQEICVTYKYLQNPEAMYVVIDNNDILTMRVMLNDKRFLGHIGRGGHELLQRAIFKKRKKIAELLIASKYCNFNDKCPDYINDWITKENNKKEELYPLIAILDNHHCPIACWKYFEHIKSLLIKPILYVID